MIPIADTAMRNANAGPGFCTSGEFMHARTIMPQIFRLNDSRVIF